MKRIHHVGIVMPTIERAEAFMRQFGHEEDYREFVPVYQADCIFLKYSEYDSPIELVEPHGGPLADFNNGKGGVHHIAYEVDDVDRIQKDYEEKGVKLLESKGVKGAGNIRVNFLRPRDAGGILVEFVEVTG